MTSSLQPNTLRLAALAFLAAATPLFAIGAAVEHATASAPTPASESSSHVGSGSEAVEQHDSGGATSEQSLAGLDPEGIPAVTVAFLVSIAAGAALWLWWRRRLVLVLTMLVAAGFAVLDARELVHQVGVAEAPVAVLAGGVTILHAATAVCLVMLIRAVSQSSSVAAQN